MALYCSVSIMNHSRKKLASELAEETDPEQIKKIKYLIQRYVSVKQLRKNNFHVCVGVEVYIAFYCI